jgi:ribonuclease E
VIRDVFNEDFSSLVVSGDDAWDMVEEYVRYVAPHLAERVSRWQADRDVFAEYRIDEQLAKALERKVWLPSGGSLVIDKTEAMTVVDVNTGKFTGQGGNLEETVTRNNLEAAEEIVRQLRLRDVGGIVVIDFIDMVLESNRELVLRRLLECLARDRTKHQVAEVTSLGLVQMTRKRVGAGLLEAFSTPCECCNGRGVILNFEPDGDGQSSHHVHARNGGNGGRNVAAVAPRPEQADADKPDAPPRQDNGRQDNGRQENGQAEPPRPPSRRRRRKAPATVTATAGTPAPAEPEAPPAHDGAA